MVLNRLLATGLMAATVLAGCMANDASSGDPSGDGVSSQLTGALTVGGYYCPQRGEIAGRTIPSDETFYMTTFGGGPDTGHMACGGIADGRWMYIADSWRYGCGAHVKITNPRTGRWCVAQVADVGPNICVEHAAGRPIIDASPVISRELFGTSGAGWSDHTTVRAELVAGSTPLGCGSGSTAPAPPAHGGGTVSGSGGTGPTPPDSPGSGCFSATLGRHVPGATCLQSRLDGAWYQCTSIGWVPNTHIPTAHSGDAGSCTETYALH